MNLLLFMPTVQTEVSEGAEVSYPNPRTPIPTCFGGRVQGRSSDDSYDISYSSVRADQPVSYTV